MDDERVNFENDRGDMERKQVLKEELARYLRLLTDHGDPDLVNCLWLSGCGQDSRLVRY